jgi:hypothetical protein
VGRFCHPRSILAPLLLALAAFVPSASAQRSVLSLNPWVTADFDGDRTADMARAGSFRHDGSAFIQEISLGFSTRESHAVSVRISGLAFKLVARDVDGDSDRDLIVEALSLEPLAVLLNDGGGQFHEAPLKDFKYLFAHHERSSWNTAGRLSLNTFARDASQNDASVAHITAAFAGLIPAGLVEDFGSRDSSANLHNPRTRGPPTI